MFDSSSTISVESVMYHDKFVQDIVDQLKEVEGLKAIVLGGSWASETQHPDSDIDLGLYYSEDTPLEVNQIRKIAFILNDFPHPEVTALGEWGKWVNGGAWLTIRGQRVDFLYRNIDFVSTSIDDCNRGETQFDYFQQPPYGFYSYIYCAETQICKTLYDPSGVIDYLKSKIVGYSTLLKYNIINGFLWNAEFSLEVAKKSAQRREVYYVAGCFTRIASSLVQVLYALNETYFISDKRLYKDIELFSIKPQNFTQKLHDVLGAIGYDDKRLEETLWNTKTLLSEVIVLCEEKYTPKFALDSLSPKSH